MIINMSMPLVSVCRDLCFYGYISIFSFSMFLRDKTVEL